MEDVQQLMLGLQADPAWPIAARNRRLASEGAVWCVARGTKFYALEMCLSLADDFFIVSRIRGDV